MGKTGRLLVALAIAFALGVGASSARPLQPPSGHKPLAAPTALPSMRPLRLSALASAGSTAQLYADSCVSSSECWAVGFVADGSGAALGRALHFHNGTWSEVSVPQPGSTRPKGYDYLDGVHCGSPTNCWAVGYYGNKAGATLNEVLHWNGKKWNSVAISQPAGTAKEADQNHLNGVTCTGATNCWAVGDYANGAGALVNAAFHWDGQKWTLVPTPNGHGTAKGEENVLYGVACIAASDCLAVGYGRTHTGQYVTEALQWTGTAWATQATPRPGRSGKHGYAYLSGLTCVSASECWAVGGYNNVRKPYSNEIVMWDGTSWRRVRAPHPKNASGGAELSSVSCVAATSCWAVGYYFKQGGELDQALRWNGTRWSVVATPRLGKGAYADLLRGVSCTSRTKCWAVGYTYSAPGLLLGKLLLRWNGKKWSVG